MNVVVVVVGGSVLPSGGATVDVSVTSVPVRSAFTRARALSVEPARLVKFEAILVATSVCPALVVVVVTVPPVVVPPVPVPPVVCANASGATAAITVAASKRILGLMSFFSVTWFRRFFPSAG